MAPTKLLWIFWTWVSLMGPRKEERSKSGYREASLLDPALLACRVMLRFMAVWKCGHDFIRGTVSPLPRNLQVVTSQRCERVFHQCCAWVKLQLALHLLLLTILQLNHLPPLLPPTVCNSSCLFTQCPPQYASCCTVTTVFFKVLYFRNILFFFFMFYLCESIINLWPYSTV